MFGSRTTCIVLAGPYLTPLRLPSSGCHLRVQTLTRSRLCYLEPLTGAPSSRRLALGRVGLARPPKRQRLSASRDARPALNSAASSTLSSASMRAISLGDSFECALVNISCSCTICKRPVKSTEDLCQRRCHENNGLACQVCT